MFPTHFDVLCALTEHTCMAKWDLFVLYNVLILVILLNISNIFKKLEDLHAHNFVFIT